MSLLALARRRGARRRTVQPVDTRRLVPACPLDDQLVGIHAAMPTLAPRSAR